MKGLESGRNDNSAIQQERKDFAVFDYYWQHLQRNEYYRSITDPSCRSYSSLAGLKTIVKRAGARSSANREIRFADSLVDQGHPNRLSKTLNYSRRVGIAACRENILLLPELLNPVKFADSGDAWRRIIQVQPDFLRTPQWQAIKTKNWKLAAFWNLDGADGNGWYPYIQMPKSSGWFEIPITEAILCEPAREFRNALLNLDQAEADLAALEASDGGKVKQSINSLRRKIVTLEERIKSRRAELEGAKAKLRLFLNYNPRMDFVLDTALPWGTVSKALKKEWDTIKDFRKRVDLVKDIDPPRKVSQWLDYLHLYDAYLPQWKTNQRKLTALKRIWVEELGFIEAFSLLGLKLPEEDLALARKLDDVGKIPKAFYKLLEGQQKKVILAGGWNDGLEHNVRNRKLRLRRASLHFDYDDEVVLDAFVSKQAVKDLSHTYFGPTGAILNSWRCHFSIPRVQLPHPFDHLSRKKRNRWFHAARRQIEAVWQGKVEAFSIPAS